MTTEERGHQRNQSNSQEKERRNNTIDRQRRVSEWQGVVLGGCGCGAINCVWLTNEGICMLQKTRKNNAPKEKRTQNRREQIKTWTRRTRSVIGHSRSALPRVWRWLVLIVIIQIPLYCQLRACGVSAITSTQEVSCRLQVKRNERRAHQMWRTNASKRKKKKGERREPQWGNRLWK